MLDPIVVLQMIRLNLLIYSRVFIDCVCVQHVQWECSQEVVVPSAGNVPTTVTPLNQE